jgi:hypothetical protein
LELPIVGLAAKAKGGGSVYDILVQASRCLGLAGCSRLNCHASKGHRMAHCMNCCVTVCTRLILVFSDVQEIKATKLQQKLLAKSLVELQRNASVQYADLAGDVASLAAALSKLPAQQKISDEELAARVDLLVKAHLLQVSNQMLGLQAALASAGQAGQVEVGGAV